MPGDQLETLAKFIHSRKQDTPYVVLLGSGLSMTSDLLKELGYADWNAFHAYVQLRSPNEWYSLLKEPLNALPLQEGYRCLVQLLQVGYFNVILTTNFDSLLDQALNEAKRSSPEEIDILVNGEQTTEYIIRALKNPQPRMKICLLRGRLHSKSVPDITGMLQLDSTLEEALKDLLKGDLIVLGACNRDVNIAQRIAPGGSIWYITFEATAPDDAIRGLIQHRSLEIITERKGGFNQFFSILAQKINLLQDEKDLTFVSSKQLTIEQFPIVPIDQPHEQYDRIDVISSIGRLVGPLDVDKDKPAAHYPELSTEKRDGNGYQTHPSISAFGTGKQWGVIVGIAEYEDQTAYKQLEICVNDAESLYQQLILCNFHPERLRLLTGYPFVIPDKQTILSHLETIVQKIEPEDSLLFYYSGILEGDDNDTYLIASNSLASALQETAIPMRQVKELMVSSGARTKIIILDIRHSEIHRLDDNFVRRKENFIHHVLEKSEGIAILTSFKKEVDRQTQYSAFTHSITEKLKRKSTTIGVNKGSVSIIDLYSDTDKGIQFYQSIPNRLQNSIFCQYYTHASNNYLPTAYLYVIKIQRVLSISRRILSNPDGIDTDRCKRVLALLYAIDEIPPLGTQFTSHDELSLRDGLHKIYRLISRLPYDIIELRHMSETARKGIKIKVQAALDKFSHVGLEVDTLADRLRRSLVSEENKERRNQSPQE